MKNVHIFAHGSGRPLSRFPLVLNERLGRALLVRGHGVRLALFLVVMAWTMLFFPWPAAASDTHVAQGRASWYGTTAHGRQTANGEIYNKYALTAAHKGLPFGTVLRVKNMKNGRQVLVRINDRGPFIKGRILDVSHRAAEALKMIRSGVVPITMEIVANQKGEPLNKENSFYIHLANAVSALKTRETIANFGKKLQAPVHALAKPGDKGLSYAVCLGPFDTFDKAQRQFLKLEKTRTPLLGIIEGPARKDTPADAVPQPPRGITDEADALAGQEPLLNDSIAPLLYSYCQALGFSPALPIKKSLMLFTVFTHQLPDFTSSSLLFCLPYPALSGYRYSPS